MKKILVMLLLTTGLFAQDKIYNVQQYCIDNKPFTELGCDISANEYSFVFVDTAKNEVVLFLSDTKLRFDMVESEINTLKGSLHYTLKSAEGITAMTVSRQKTKIEFVHPQRKITLKVGKSTKLE